MTTDDVLMKTLQAEFLTDPEGLFDQFLDALNVLRRDPAQGIRELLKSTHSLKGTAQAIGLRHFAAFVDSLEDALNEVQQNLGNKALSEQDGLRLENLVSAGIRSIEALFHALRSGENDSPELVASHGAVLNDLRQWRQGMDTGDWGMAEAASPAEPAPRLVLVSSAPPAAESGEPALPSVPAFPPPRDLTPRGEAVSSHGNDTRRFLLLEQRERLFGVPVDAVVEILERRPWCPLPIRRRGILGVMNRFGEVLPVLDFQNLVGVRGEAGAHEPVRGTIVVCRASGRRFGFPVDNVSQIIDLKVEEMQSASHIEIRKHNGVVTDMALLGSRTLLIVDLNKLIE